MIKRRRLGATLTQRRLEDLTGIDQTVISRLENGKQYGLRWSRFAILVATLDGLCGDPRPLVPWWRAVGLRPPSHVLEDLRREGLIPPLPDSAGDDDADDDPDGEEPAAKL